MTAEGRLIAVGLMFMGIGFIGVFTATMTSFLLEPNRLDDEMSIEQRLARIDIKLDALTRERAERGESNS